MTDLITRLRHGSSHLAHDATMQEAAAEIERLRAEVAALRKSRNDDGNLVLFVERAIRPPKVGSNDGLGSTRQ